jgi:Helix-turn-helix domain
MEMKVAKRFDHIAEKKVYLRDQLVTIGDLQQLRDDLLNDIRQLLKINNSAIERKWLKSHEVMKLLKISPGTLQTLRFNGSLKFSKVGGIIYYRHDDILQMLETHIETAP